MTPGEGPPTLSDDQVKCFDGRVVSFDTIAVPSAWREHVVRLLGRPGPAHMGDGRDAGFRPWEVGYDPDDPVDRAVMHTRKAVFPLHGLDPWFD